MVHIRFKGGRQSIRVNSLRKAITMVETIASLEEEARKKYESEGTPIKITSSMVYRVMIKKGTKFSPTLALFLAYVGVLKLKSTGYWNKHLNHYQYQNHWFLSGHKVYNLEYLKSRLKIYEDYLSTKKIIEDEDYCV